jgi:hypothetical protein
MGLQHVYAVVAVVGTAGSPAAPPGNLAVPTGAANSIAPAITNSRSSGATIGTISTNGVPVGGQPDAETLAAGQNQEPKKDKKKLNAGVIVAIVLLVLLFLIAAAVGGWMLWHRRRGNEVQKVCLTVCPSRAHIRSRSLAHILTKIPSLNPRLILP